MVMAKPQDLPYKKADVLRAFRMFVDRDAPTGQISPEALEKALVGVA
jgi:centrin-1